MAEMCLQRFQNGLWKKELQLDTSPNSAILRVEKKALLLFPNSSKWLFPTGFMSPAVDGKRDEHTESQNDDKLTYYPKIFRISLE